ncbi:MAG: hypothetical protein M5U01_22290 [Ardenticatenaceae bacterium]|nr:hypothetical protein [Ardenticatenaceae bacterium]HBY99071.1 hypothetical protein [Chloroflexota bacterium]
MSETHVERRLRRFLLVMAGLMCAGTVVELWLAGHMESPIQFVPFILCGLGLTAILAVLCRPQRRTLLGLRGVVALLVVGSLVGIYEHGEQNLAFELEIRPNATAREVLPEALRGASPLLAPGILALAGVLALGATYSHPALERRPAEGRGDQDGQSHAGPEPAPLGSISSGPTRSWR